MNALIRAYDWFVSALAYLAGVATVLMFALIVYDVLARELAGVSLNFTIGVVEYGLLYFTLFAAPYLVRTRGHVYIEALIVRLPDPIRLVLEQIVYVLCALAAGLFAYLSLVLLGEKIETGVIDIRGIDFPGWLVVAPLPVGYGLVAIEFLRFLFGSRSMYRRDGLPGEGL